MHARAGLILANRAFEDNARGADGARQTVATSGGLLAAVRPAIQPWEGGAGTTWIGAAPLRPGERDTLDDVEFVDLPNGKLRQRRLTFDHATWAGHYSAVANGFLWPLLHLVRLSLPELAPYYPRPATPSSAEWAAFERVNRAFATAASGEPAGTAWIHDYQLALAPAMLRRLSPGRPIGFFLHTPFPDPEVATGALDPAGFGRVSAIVRGLLGADLVGFQSKPDVARFAAWLKRHEGLEPVAGTVRLDGRTVRFGDYPVGIDADEVDALAALPGGSPEAREAAALGLPLVVGLERSDYTKGIPERLESIAAALESGSRFAYLGIAAPTRLGVAAYDRLEAAIRAAAARAQRAATVAGVPFLQLRRGIPFQDVVALQREADVVFTSSLADGMNLVPLQSAVAQSCRPAGRRAVLMAGRDAGVSQAYGGSAGVGLVIIDPFDRAATARTLAAAVAGTASRVTDAFIQQVRGNDARAWATRFLTDLEDALC